MVLNSCAGMTPDKDAKTFWNQKVTVEAYGFSMVTPYGPFNLGYMSWQRNVDEPQKPSGKVTVPAIPFASKP